MSSIAEYPTDSHLRVFHAPRRLSPEEVSLIRDDLTDFVEKWTAETRPVTGTFEIVHDQFIVVAADETMVPLTGCAKDSMTRRVRKLSDRIGADLVQGPPICFRDGEDIKAVTRAEFGELVKGGEVTAETVVFDNTIISVGPYVGGKWEIPAKDCWHGRAYKLNG